MKKAPHIIWVCPSNPFLYRSKGEIKTRPGSVVPKIIEQGIKLDILIPHDPSLLPKSKLSPSRILRDQIKLGQTHPIEIIKLTRGAASPGVYMAKLPVLDAPLFHALFAHTALALARQINKPVDIFHLFGWETGLLPLYLELQKKGSKLFQNTKTFFNVVSLRQQGNYSPGLLNYLDVPKELFHPDGIEFFGKVSFLKTGLLFADGVGVVDGAQNHGRHGTGFEGILDSISFKLRRWASDRALRTYMEAYRELLMITKTSSLLPHLLKKLHSNKNEAEKFIESWGPIPPERYQKNALSFILQSPRKAYAFWEWVDSSEHSYGLVLEDVVNGSRVMLDRGLEALGDYWIDVLPGRSYVVELQGLSPKGHGKTLLRSQPLFIPRDSMSSNTTALFIDVKTKERKTLQSNENWLSLGRQRGDGSSAWEWSDLQSQPHSLQIGKK